MNPVEIPSDFTIPLLGIQVEAHWSLHAWLMFSLWFVLAPVSILAMRYLKPKPREYGVPNAGSYFFSRMHFLGLQATVVLSLLGGALAFLVSRGFSGSLHACFGVATILFGTLQIISAWMRGTHGGKYGHDANPDDPSTWGGDHYDMTPRRIWFEAYHKASGYFTLAMAFGAIATGLAQYWVGSIALAGVVLFFGYGVIVVVAEGKGMRFDTYRAVYGTHPDHPGNQRRDGYR